MAATISQMAERVLKRCTPNDDGCWVFPGATAKGYGRVGTYDQGVQRVYQAHRVVYMHLVDADLDPALVLDHLCKERRCVNPEHLEPVTPTVNTERAVEVRNKANAEKTHCPRGHPYTRQNTYTPKGKTGRYCRECGRIATRKWRDKSLSRFRR
jgi:hypothetical protein